MYIYMYVCVYVCIYIYVCVCANVYVNEYVNVCINVDCETWVSPLPEKTNERFQSLRYSLHAEGGWLCMQHPGPRNGATIVEAFPSSGNIAARFWGRFLAPRKSKQELLDGPDARISSICWRQPSFCNASCHGHTQLLRNILSNYWCGMHRTCKNNSSKSDRGMRKKKYIYIYIKV